MFVQVAACSAHALYSVHCTAHQSWYCMLSLPLVCTPPVICSLWGSSLQYNNDDQFIYDKLIQTASLTSSVADINIRPVCSQAGALQQVCSVLAGACRTEEMASSWSPQSCSEQFETQVLLCVLSQQSVACTSVPQEPFQNQGVTCW